MFQFDKFSAFIYEYKWLWGAALVGYGLFMAFMGNKLVNAVIFIVTATAFFFVAGTLFFQIALAKIKAEWAMWLSIAAIIVVGCLLGYFLQKYRKYGIALLAGWGGILVGFSICTAFFVGNQSLSWVIVLGCGIAGGILTIYIEKFVIITTTSFIGSYAAVRGVSLYLGGYPSELQLQSEISSGAVDWENYDKKFYIYLGAIVILFIASHTF